MSEKKTPPIAPTEPPANAVDPAAEAAKILADAEARAAEIVAAAEAKAQETMDAAVKASAPKPLAPNNGEELVTIQLFKDSERYKDDVDVAVNGRLFRIKRGEPVKVPAYIAKVLEQSMKQDAATAIMIDQKSSEYEAQAKALQV